MAGFQLESHQNVVLFILYSLVLFFSAWIWPECRLDYLSLNLMAGFWLESHQNVVLFNLYPLVLFFSAWIWPECHSLYSLVLFFWLESLNLTSNVHGDCRCGLDLEFRSISIFRPQYPHSSEGSKLTQSWLRNLPSKQIFLHKKLNNKIACIVSIPMVWIIDKMLSSTSWGNYFLDFSGDFIFLHGFASWNHFLL